MNDALPRRLALGLLALALPLQVRAQSILVDFGTSSSFRGASVPTPDENGNVWNGFAPGAFLANLVDTAGAARGLSMGFTTPIGTDSYNGPAGPTSDPPTPAELANTRFDPAALGELGATNAVFDYFGAGAGLTARFTLSNLNPLRTYNLTFFGSRKYPTGEEPGNQDSRTTVYAVTDSFGTELVFTNLLVGSFGDHNSNTVVTLTGLVPDALNRIFVAFRGLTPTNAGYLNAMKIEAVEPPPRRSATRSC